jgi:hypothetical protein
VQELLTLKDEVYLVMHLACDLIDWGFLPKAPRGLS